MEPQATGQSSSDQRRATMRWARRSTFVAWFCGLASVGLAWAQARWYVFHPHFLPLTLLFLGLALTTSMALACGVWRILRGPSRIQALFITAIALLPAGFWANVGYVANTNVSNRWIPNTLTMRLAKVMGATFMDLETRLAYRRRLETERLVMIYDARHPKHAQRVDRPEEDLAACCQPPSGGSGSVCERQPNDKKLSKLSE